MLKLYDFSVDYVKNPTIVKTKDLRFGWKLDSDNIDVLQTSYRIIIKNEDGTAADTGIVKSEDVCDITIDSLKLKSCTDYTVEITVTDNKGETAKFARKISTEILPEEWRGASWIKPAVHISGWAPYMRTKFEAKGVKKAIMYASGLGCAEYYINGKRTDDYYIDPPMSNYEKTVFYRRFDVTELIREGGNALAVLLGEGFYSQSRVWGHNGFKYGDVCAKIKLILYLDNGAVKEICTDTENWKYKYSPVTVNNIYGGETYDCRLETPDFSNYDGDEKGWEGVIIDETPKGTLTPSLIPPVRVIRELPAVNHYGSSGKADGTWIYDIGVNMAGVAEFNIPHSPKGAVYVFRYAETVNEHGELDFRSTGSCATQCIQQDIYICRGDVQGEVYRPRFCYHSYRFVEVSGIHDFSQGYGTTPQLSIVKGIQISTDMAKIAEFSTSYDFLNKFYRITDNTFRSNFHGLPEDCPAREKCGWLGDAQVVSNFGLLNYDSAAAYEKYLDDIRTTCEVYGTWQMISPGKRGCGNASPLWGCAQIIIPYYIYKYYGNKEAVVKNADLMRAWVQNELNRSQDYIISEGLGDWDPAGSNENSRRMPVSHSSSLMFYEICTIMAELCTDMKANYGIEIGDAAEYFSLAGKIKESFIRHFYDFERHSYGYWGSDGVALAIGLYPDGERASLIKALCEMIEKDDYEMPTGIYGNKYLTPVLREEGFGDMALQYLFNAKHYSFGTLINDNATTIWEEPDMHFIEKRRDRSVASYNHPMHGGFMYFCITHLSGIRPAKPGFGKFIFKPCFTETADSIKTEFNSPYGTISVEINNDKAAGKRVCAINVPSGSSCIIDINAENVTVDGIKCEGQVCVGSGRHETIIFS